MWTLSRWKLCEPKMARKKTLRGYNGCLKMQSLAITKKGSSWEHSLGFCVVCFHRKNGGWSSFKTEKKLKRTLKNPSGHARLHFSALSVIFIRWRLWVHFPDFKQNYFSIKPFTRYLCVKLVPNKTSIFHGRQVKGQKGFTIIIIS